jgi:hypothetical protein
VSEEIKRILECRCMLAVHSQWKEENALGVGRRTVSSGSFLAFSLSVHPTAFLQQSSC